MVTIKLKLIGDEMASNPDYLDAITRSNERARSVAQVYEKAGPFVCEEHPEQESTIVVTAVFQSSIRVSKLKFCCQALADQIEARMALMKE